MTDFRMPDINEFHLAARLTRDPDLRHLPNGTPVAEFNIVYDHRVKRGDEWEMEPHFFQVQAWDKVADQCHRLGLAKGVPVLIDGKVLQETWKGRKGTKERKTRIRAYRVQRLDWPAKPEDEKGGDTGEDDLPF